MNFIFQLLLTFTLIISSLFFSSCSQSVKGVVWELPNTAQDFPELSTGLIPQKILNAKLNNLKTNGLVFSGGGTRSASLTLGQLRALNDLGILNKIHYISAVSGGAWSAVPYIYAKSFKDSNKTYFNNSYTMSTDFLGKYIPPIQLHKEDLTGDKNLGDLGKTITKSSVLFNSIYGWTSIKGDETFSYVIGQIFLEPFNLEKNIFFTLNKKVKKNILLDNNVTNSSMPFYTAGENKPFLIVGSTIQLKHKLPTKRKVSEIFPLEITPLYVGIPTKKSVLGRDSRYIGGGYIEPFMYNSPPPQYNTIIIDNRRSTTVKIQNKINRFSLSDMIGTSGAAPQATITSSIWKFLGLSNAGFPELHHWPITNEENYYPENEDFIHGDGGNIDNIGLMPLLARKVDNIIVFINTQENFDSGYSNADIPSFAMYQDLQDYFKYNNKRPKNIIFDTKELTKLYNAFESRKKSGEPLVYCQKYKIKENLFYGITKDESYTPKICWFYNDKASKWVDEIRNNPYLGTEKNKILKEEKKYEHIPHSFTFLEHWSLIDRNNRDVNSESNIGSWSVCESANLLSTKMNFKIKQHKNCKSSEAILELNN